jgi:hypothetical protein
MSWPSNTVGCGCIGGNGSYPNCNGNVSEETVSSWLNNLTTNLFGTVTKSLSSTGGVVWSGYCNPNTYGLIGYPRNTGEGLLCYITRILGILGWINGGVWSSTTVYNPNTVVSSGASLYLSSQVVPAGIAITNTLYWTLLLTAPTGPAGPTGSSATPTRAVRTVTAGTTATNTDDLIYLNPSAPATVSLQLYSAYTSGKYFTLESSGAYPITIATTGTDVIVNPATGASAGTYVIYGYSSLTLYSNNDGTWRVT